MIYDFIAISIIVISLIIIAVIITKKFPIISSINVASIPKHKQEKVKDDLIEDRLKRKFKGFKAKTTIRVKPLKNRVTYFFQNFYRQVVNLERRYREKIKAIEPEEEEELGQKREVLLEEAKSLVEQDKLKEAEDKYIEIISLNPKDIDAYNGLGDVYTKMKDYQHAKETFQHILRLDAQDDTAYASLGMIAIQEGDLKQAEKDYAQSVALNNKVAAHHIDLGEACLALRDINKALKCFQEAVRLEPNNPKNLDLLLEASIKIKDKSLAQQTYGSFKKVNPENEKLKDYKEKIDKL